MTSLNSHSTETELVQALKAQDEQAMVLLYDRYSAALYRIVLKIVREEELAKDVLQEAFVKIWHHFADYHPSKGRLFTWLLNVARNLAVDIVRSASYRHRALTHSLAEGSAYLASMSTHQPALSGMEALLAHLRTEERLLVDLIYFQGYTRPEVAARLDIPLGTVKTRLRAVMMKLRKCSGANDY